VGAREQPGPQVRLAARRLAIGQAVAPPPEIIFHILGEKFGMWPEQVASLPVDEVVRAWQLHAEMQPKERK
jgi:hypothetical protein